MAVVVAFMSMLLMSALAAALVLTTSAEAMIAANFRNAHEGLHAADAALELAIAELAAVPDWTPLLDGSASSGLAHDRPGVGWTVADGSSLDLDRLVNNLNCRDPRRCDGMSLVASTAQRPWGANNPVWRLHAYGPLTSFLPVADLDAAEYVIIMLADDPSENDGDPRRDGGAESNPGSGVIAVRAEAFGVGGTHQVVQMMVARAGSGQPPGSVRVLSWRLL